MKISCFLFGVRIPRLTAVPYAIWFGDPRLRKRELPASLCPFFLFHGLRWDGDRHTLTLYPVYSFYVYSFYFRLCIDPIETSLSFFVFCFFMVSDGMTTDTRTRCTCTSREQALHRPYRDISVLFCFLFFHGIRWDDNRHTHTLYLYLYQYTTIPVYYYTHALFQSLVVHDR